MSSYYRQRYAQGQPEAEPSEAPPAEAEDDAEGNGATPAAVRLADELGVDLSTVTGTGAGGRILAPDVQAAYDEAEA